MSEQLPDIDFFTIKRTKEGPISTIDLIAHLLMAMGFDEESPYMKSLYANCITYTSAHKPVVLKMQDGQIYNVTEVGFNHKRVSLKTESST